MKNKLPGLLAVVIALAGGTAVISRSAPRAENQQVDRAAITAVLAAQESAWNRGDVDSFLQGYWRSPELTFSGTGGTSCVQGKM